MQIRRPATTIKSVRTHRAISAICIGIISFYIGYNSTNTLLSSSLTIYNTASIVHKEVSKEESATPTPISTYTEPKPFTMLFLGDMMFDRGVATNIRKRGSDYVFASGTKALTANYDLVIANLEGPITTYASKTIDASGKAIPGFSFTFPTSTASLLKESGIDIVSIANNHSDNFGREGLRQTIQYLTDAGIQYFGNPTNALFDISPNAYVHCPVSLTTRDIHIPPCIAFIGYHQFAYKNESVLLDTIRAYSLDPRIAFIVIFPHWGEEYQKTPNQTQVSLAHQWIDAGADLIIGAHPHVVQSVEVYKNAYIYYSLGNYIFDQYFSYDTTHGIVVDITLSPDLTTLQSTHIIPIDITGTVVKKENK